MDLWHRLGGWAELTRISNLPTVWSNALLGRVVAMMAFVAAGGQLVGVEHEPLTMLVYAVDRGFPLFIAVTFFYFGGMILNDLCDLPIDRHDQPRRPLPSGRVSVKAAWVAVVTFFVLGMGALSLYQLPWLPMLVGLALVGAIVLYDWLHKRSVHAVWFMGACRGLVYVLGAATLGVEAGAFREVVLPMVLPLAAVVTLYTVMITYIARLEHTGRVDARRWLGVAMILVVLSPVAWHWPGAEHLFAVGLTAALLVGWLVWALWQVLRDPPATKGAVMAWLAGLCLIDAYLLALIGFPLAGLVAGGCFVVTVALQRVVSGT